MLSLVPESRRHWVDTVSMLQPPGGAMITPSRLWGPGHHSLNLHPKGKSLKLLPRASMFQLSSFTAQAGDSFPGSGTDPGDSRAWRLIHLSSQVLCWMLPRLTVQHYRSGWGKRPWSSSDPVNCPHSPVSLIPTSVRALLHSPSSRAAV